MRKINMYAHLNEDDKVPFSIPDTVKTVESLNYGAQRFLSELVLLREKSPEYQKYESFQIHTAKLRKLLEEGWY